MCTVILFNRIIKKKSPFFLEKNWDAVSDFGTRFSLLYYWLPHRSLWCLLGEKRPRLPHREFYKPPLNYKKWPPPPPLPDSFFLPGSLRHMIWGGVLYFPGTTIHFPASVVSGHLFLLPPLQQILPTSSSLRPF